MDTLAGYGSSSSDDDSTTALESSGMVDYDDSGDEHDNVDDKVQLVTMRQQSDNAQTQQDQACSEIKKIQFPKPILHSDNAFDALVTFSKDYLHDRLSNVEVKPVEPKLQHSLQSLYERFGSGTEKTFAEHMRSQKEFNNPHFFSEVIDHFNIDANGSNFSSDLYGGYEDFEDVDNIVEKEEQARTAIIQRQHQQQQQYGNNLALNISMNKIA